MIDPSTISHRYPLFVRGGENRVFLKLKDEGVELTSEGLVWWINGEVRRRPYRDIATVRLAVQGVAKVGMMGSCQIVFHDNQQLTVMGCTAHGLADDERSKIYGAFVRDLHIRLVSQGANIAFQAGVGNTRRKVLGAGLVLGAVFFIGIPFVILFAANDTRGLKFAVIGGLLLYYPFKMWKANKPRLYSPDAIPANLLP